MTRPTGAPPVLDVARLSVSFGSGPTVVDDLSLRAAAGECVALVGESGAGKSVTARTLLGLTGAGCRVSAERLHLTPTAREQAVDLQRLSTSRWRRVRGRRIGLISQDALVGLDPLRLVGREVADAVRLHERLSPSERRRRMLGALAESGLDDPELRAGQYAWQLSGGQRQRALIASASISRPALLIADEPTTALDANVRLRILGLLSRLRDEGAALLLISHDLELVEHIADTVVVLHDGRAVESGPVHDVLDRPRSAHTRRLLASSPRSVPRGRRLLASDPLPDVMTTRSACSGATDEGGPLLRAAGLSRRFATRGGSPITAVDNVTVEVRSGRTLGIVGESGSGKTTLARMMLGLERPDAGTVELLGGIFNPLGERARRPLRQTVGAIYQDPLSSFDPRWTARRVLADALTGGRRRADEQVIASLLSQVGLDPSLARRRPRALSGGQRQRLAIARALAPGPRVLICDEPVSSLDVSTQARILDLLDELQERLGLALIVISHDLGVIRHASDDVVVMRRGQVVEAAAAERLFGSPAHPYTQELLRASGFAPRTAFSPRTR